MARQAMPGIGIVLVGVLCWLLAGPPAQATPPAKHNPPKSIYLALGDSLAFGYQQAKFLDNLPTEDPAAFNTGYVDFFARDLREIKPRIQTVNLSCPGESTDSLLGLATCIYHPPYPLHSNYSGSQIDAALALLRAHPGQVSPITIDIGSNDLLRGQSLAHVQVNFRTALAKLRTAAPYSEIIVLGYYAPRGSPETAGQLNAILAQVAAQYWARFGNPLPVFNPPANQRDTICSLTLVCTPLSDTHPSDLGYQKLADLAFAASGY
jgi:lysophospholipase L1-like esterase